jgi:mannose-6-phosphate isomerase-like protein (cupin superfamily)
MEGGPEPGTENLVDMKILWMVGLLSFSLMAREPLAQRIGHGDWAKARQSPNIHGGAGTLGIQTLLNRDAIAGLNFMHYGPLSAKSSIGAHFHNDSEEMFLILDKDCEFTIDGHTALLPAPVGVPCQLRRSHAVYNPTDTPAAWVNFNVRMGEAPPRPTATGWLATFLSDPTGTFNIGDDRVGAHLDKQPSFVSTQRMTRQTARPVASMNGGKGTVLYRRALGPTVFYSNWAYVDYYLVPPGASIGSHVHNGVEEVYLVISGEGTTQVNDESAPLKKGDAVPVRVKDVHSFANTGSADMEFVVYGVALEKGKLDIADAK